jgi:hypothetical protein
MEQLTPILEWTGTYLGLVGACLLAIKFKYSGWGWIFFLISNFCWIGFAASTGIGGLGVQHFGFMFTSLLGIYRWLFLREGG